MEETITAIDLRRSAMDLLARREHSKRELTDKLTLRFGHHPEITVVVDRLIADGLQDDSRFTEAYLHSRAQRLYGPQRIKAELRERGIDESIIEAALRIASIDWQSNLQKLAWDKFGSKPAVDFKQRAQRMRFLQYRGFAADPIRRLVGDLPDD